jgi:hypothetical protein
MFRIGRDNTIINFNSDDHDDNSIICLVYGEVDCRCHIQRQIDLGRTEDSVINDLVSNYFRTISNSVKSHKTIIVVGVIPQTKQRDLESIHGPITHEFPFVGKDEDRVRYTRKVNLCIKELCDLVGYRYFDPYSHYSRDDGTLKFELSDTTGHLGDNSVFLNKFVDLYKSILG